MNMPKERILEVLAVAAKRLRLGVQGEITADELDEVRATLEQSGTPSIDPKNLKVGDYVTLNARIDYPGSRVSDVRIGDTVVKIPNGSLQSAFK